MEISLPAETTGIADRARWVLTHHGSEWKEFKCRVITDFVRQVTTWLRAVRGDDLVLGLYVPPLPADWLESWAGQRLSELTSLVDVISPMAYHAILHRSPEWVGEVIADWSTHVSHPLLPIVQVDSQEGREAGADWGPPIPLEEWERVVSLVSESSDVLGLVAFTGTALPGKGRGEGLQRSLQSP